MTECERSDCNLPGSHGIYPDRQAINWIYRGQRCVKRGWGPDDTHGWFGMDGGGVSRSLRQARNVWKDVLESSRFVGVGTFKVVWRKKRGATRQS